MTFTDLDPEQTCIVELFDKDTSWNSRYANREGYPSGAGVTLSDGMNQNSRGGYQVYCEGPRAGP